MPQCGGKENAMTLEYSIRLLAGSLVLVSLVLGLTVSPYWFILTGFVGVNLVQSAFTGFCPAEIIFKRLFFKQHQVEKVAGPRGV
jgi:hypothetical protein